MRRIILTIITVILWSWAFAYDFKAVNTDGEVLYFNILSDNVSVELVRDNNRDEHGYRYSHLTCDTLRIPETVTFNNITYTVVRLDESAFTNVHPRIKTVIIPKTVSDMRYYGSGTSSEQIGKMTFVDNNFEDILVSEDNRHFMSKKGILYTYGGDTLIAYPTRNKRDSLFLDEGVTVLSPGAFENAKYLCYIELPLSLKKISAFALCDIERLKHLVIKDNVDTITSYAIASLGLTHLTLGNGLKYLNNKAIESDMIMDIYCRATNPPFSLSHFRQIPAGSILHVPRKSLIAYQDALERSSSYQILPIEPPIVSGVNNAEVSWVQNFSATGYVWHLYSDAEHTQLVMTLTFDDRGYLIGITLGDSTPLQAAADNPVYAPQRSADDPSDEGDSEPTRRYAEYYSFTIHSLSPGRQYYYVRQSLAGERVIDEETGSFETLPDGAPTGVNPLLFEPSPQKTFENGILRIRKNGNSYNVNGTKVE